MVFDEDGLHRGAAPLDAGDGDIDAVGARAAHRAGDQAHRTRRAARHGLDCSDRRVRVPNRARRAYNAGCTGMKERPARGWCGARGSGVSLREARIMAEEKSSKDSADGTGKGKGGGAATAKPKAKTVRKTSPKRKPPGMLPPWKVLLHNADKPTFE